MRHHPLFFTAALFTSAFCIAQVSASPLPANTSGKQYSDSLNPGGHPSAQLTDAQKAVLQSQQVYSKFSLTSKSIKDGKPIPPRHAYCQANGTGTTKEAANISPALQWTAPPAGTKSLALLVVDKDVPKTFEKANQPDVTIAAKDPRQDFYHWILVDMPPRAGGMLEGLDSRGITKGGKELGPKNYGNSGQNDYAMMSEGPHGGYDGPCPPWNDQRLHHYHFTLYALDIPTLKLPKPIKGKQVEIAMQNHILAQSSFVGTFSTNRAIVRALRKRSIMARNKFSTNIQPGRPHTP